MVLFLKLPHSASRSGASRCDIETVKKVEKFAYVAGDPGQSFCAKLTDGYSRHFF